MRHMAAPESQRLIAVLFYAGTALQRSTLADFFCCEAAEVDTAREQAREQLSGTGLTLVATDTTLALVTTDTVSDTVTTWRQAELQSPLTRAGLETLALICYRAPINRSEIDYVRGVNSAAILRTLSMRGLIEQSGQRGSDGSRYYQPTTDTLTYLGIQDRSALPEYENVRSQFAAYLDGEDAQHTPAHTTADTETDTSADTDSHT